jgi:hypothetical protein
MNVKRIAYLSLAGGVLAAMIAGATTSGGRRPAPTTPAASTTAIELRGAELAAEVARLRARLRPTGEPQEPSRNLFRFGGRAARVESASIAPPPENPVAPPEEPPAPPPFTLVGLATDNGVKTAILAGLAGDVLLVTEGETLASRYRVARVDADAVELTSLANGTTVRLRLQQ